MRAKIRTIFTCGVLMIVLPWSGFFQSWKDLFYTLLGLIVCFVTYLIHRQVSGKSLASKAARTEAFVESAPIQQVNQ